MQNVFHIIEYEKRGTLWRLLSDLSTFNNHRIIETKCRPYDLISMKNEGVFVLHTSGRPFPVVNSFENLLKAGMKINLFIHVSPEYIISKGYRSFLDQISVLSKKYNFKIMVPSSAICEQFLGFGIHTVAVRLGIKRISISNPTRDLCMLKNKIITVNTNNSMEYLVAKGIDKFIQLIRELGLEKHAAILGIDEVDDSGIIRKKLSHEEFLWVLSNAKAYVQLSRNESYNITAIEAKQLRIPIMVSNVEGHIDNVCNPFWRVNTMAEAKEKLIKILNEDDYVIKKVEENYTWSLENETAESFKKGIEDIVL